MLKLLHEPGREVRRLATCTIDVTGSHLVADEATGPLVGKPARSHRSHLQSKPAESASNAVTLYRPLRNVLI